MKLLINKMREVFNEVVINYRKDFSYDVEFINSADYSGFFWVPRENGTHLIGLQNFTGLDLNEKVPFLFGTSTRLEIQKTALVSLKHEKKEGRQDSIYHYDRKTGVFRKVKYFHAIEILSKHVKRLENRSQK